MEAKTFIVIRIDENGDLKVKDNPIQHGLYESAVDECERLCKTNLGKFGIFEMCGTVEAFTEIKKTLKTEYISKNKDKAE